jgi:hypothetical protein
MAHNGSGNIPNELMLLTCLLERVWTKVWRDTEQLDAPRLKHAQAEVRANIEAVEPITTCIA